MIQYNSLEVSEKLFCQEPGANFCVEQMTGTAIHIA